MKSKSQNRLLLQHVAMQRQLVLEISTVMPVKTVSIARTAQRMEEVAVYVNNFLY